MKNSETVKKVASAKTKIIVIDGKEFTTKEASIHYNVGIESIYRWAKRGYTTNGIPCHYKNEE